MSIITLTTDHGLKDFTVSAIKGSIFKEFAEAKIIDISHDVPKFDIMQAAFILRNAYKHFPKGTVHIVGVMPFETTDISHLAIYHEDQYFIAADNGVFSLLFDVTPKKIIQLNILSAEDDAFGPTRDVFVKAACHIARGGTLEVLGRPKEEINQRQMFRPIVTEKAIKGYVIYIDHFGNAITNISEVIFKDVGQGRPFKISFRIPGYEIKEISKKYNDVPQGERLALFGITEFLEIAIHVGNASELLGLRINDMVTVDFI